MNANLTALVDYENILQLIADDLWRRFDPCGISSNPNDWKCAVTLYLFDTLTEEYRLVGYAGVRDKAPMFGPLVPERTYRKLVQETAENPDWNEDVLNCYLNGNFIEREAVRSCLRKRFFSASADKSIPSAVLFLNFRSGVTPGGAAIKEQVHSLSLPLWRVIQQAQCGITADTPVILHQIGALARIARAMAAITSVADIDDVYDAILRNSLELTDAPKEAVASLHLLRADKKELEWIRGRKSDNTLVNPAEKHWHINLGVTGCVARTEHPLLITRLHENPKYDSIFINPMGRVTNCELAVPMFGAEGRLLGVLNLESEDKDAFREAHVRMMCRLADFGAIAIQTKQHLENLNGLLRILTALPATNWQSLLLGEIAEWGAKVIGANAADIWLKQDGSWIGQAYGDKKAILESEGAPRAEGFSDAILKNNQPILISSIEGVRDFELASISTVLGKANTPG